MKKSITLLDRGVLTDLQMFLQRAKRLDPVGMVRLRAFGDVLAAYVAPIFAGSLMDGGPTVLGLRTAELAEKVEVDVIAPISSVLDRIALLAADTKSNLVLELPESGRAAWAGISPPRTGWVEIGTINESELTAIAKDGIAAVGGQTTSATKEKQNEEHTGTKNCPTVQANEKHSSEAAALPGVMGRARNRKEKENQSSEGASLPAVVSPPRNPPRKKNVSI